MRSGLLEVIQNIEQFFYVKAVENIYALLDTIRST